GFIGALGGLLNSIPGVLISSFTGIDASVILRGADAKINIRDATITSTSTVDIKSETKVETTVNAIAAGMGGLVKVTGAELAVGYGQATSDVEANIGGATNITAAGSVTVTAKGAVSTKTVSRASSNLITPTVNPNSRSVAVAIAYTDLNALAQVGRE